MPLIYLNPEAIHTSSVHQLLISNLMLGLSLISCVSKSVVKYNFKNRNVAHVVINFTLTLNRARVLVLQRGSRDHFPNCQGRIVKRLLLDGSVDLQSDGTLVGGSERRLSIVPSGTYFAWWMEPE